MAFVLCGVALPLAGGSRGKAAGNRTLDWAGSCDIRAAESPRRVSRTLASSVRIQKIRFEVHPADAVRPSTLLKFDMLNVGEHSGTDVATDVVILRNSGNGFRPRVLVGNLSCSDTPVTEPGHTVNCDMSLRSFTPERYCTAACNDCVSSHPVGAGLAQAVRLP
jgi:hypothetical protein